MEYAYRVEGERKIKLSDIDPEDTHNLKRDEAEEKMSRLTAELVE